MTEKKITFNNQKALQINKSMIELFVTYCNYWIFAAVLQRIPHLEKQVVLQTWQKKKMDLQRTHNYLQKKNKHIILTSKY